MTRKEAIKNIKEHCYFASLIPQAKEALDMAIKALEQQSTLDKIRAEIEELQMYNGLYDIYINRAYVLEIIDKYRK